MQPVYCADTVLGLVCKNPSLHPSPNRTVINSDGNSALNIFWLPVQVYPVMGFPDPTVVQAAQRLISEHQGKYSQTSRILQQVTVHLLYL